MISFNPGPSQLSNQLKEYLHHMALGNFLSLSHRSVQFTDFFAELINRFQNTFRLPQNYRLFFFPSATAAMSVTIGNLVSRNCTHLVHGAFSQRFAQTALEMGKHADILKFEPSMPINWREGLEGNKTELIGITHNETSSGLMWPLIEIQELRKAFPDALLAIDVTSSFGAIPFDLSQGDIWFGSVQKVLGLPAGLGFLIASPAAIEKARSYCDKNLPAWMDLIKVADYYKKSQTFETPSAIHLALLSHQLNEWDLDDIFIQTTRKAERIYSVFQQPPMYWEPFIEEAHWRSLTVACFKVSDPGSWHEFARQNGFILGGGYGKEKGSQIRIANFPALTSEDFQMLFQCLRGKK